MHALCGSGGVFGGLVPIFFLWFAFVGVDIGFGLQRRRRWETSWDSGKTSCAKSPTTPNWAIKETCKHSCGTLRTSCGRPPLSSMLSPRRLLIRISLGLRPKLFQKKGGSSRNVVASEVRVLQLLPCENVASSRKWLFHSPSLITSSVSLLSCAANDPRFGLFSHALFVTSFLVCAHHR